MTRAILRWTAAAWLVGSASVYAQTRPDFTGVWTLDASQTTSVGGGRGAVDAPGGGRGGGLGLGPPADQVTITQSATRLTMEERRASTTSRLAYGLDGKPVANTLGSGRSAGISAMYSSVWKGDRLVTSFTIGAPLAGAEKLQYEETRFVDRNGAMVVEIRAVGQPNMRRVVYKKSK